MDNSYLIDRINSANGVKVIIAWNELLNDKTYTKIETNPPLPINDMPVIETKMGMNLDLLLKQSGVDLKAAQKRLNEVFAVIGDKMKIENVVHKEMKDRNDGIKRDDIEMAEEEKKDIGVKSKDDTDCNDEEDEEENAMKSAMESKAAAFDYNADKLSAKQLREYNQDMISEFDLLKKKIGNNINGVCDGNDWTKIKELQPYLDKLWNALDEYV